MFAHHIHPILNVSDLPASFDWFQRLGWKKCWDWRPSERAAPTFGSVGSGVCEIFLALDEQGGRGEHGVWLSIWVDDVDEIAVRCQQQGIEILQPAADKPWGVRELHIRHPDGHVFRLSQKLPTTQSQRTESGFVAGDSVVTH